MAEVIEIAITSQDVLGLKQSCQVIVDAYRSYSGSLLVEDENGVYPMLLEQVKGLRVDVEAGKNTLDNFQGLTLDDIDRPKEALGKLSSYKDIDKFVGNYSISQSVYDEAQAEIKELFDGLKHREAPRTEETEGAGFRPDNPISETTPEYHDLNYSQSLPNAQPEQINPEDGQFNPRKTLDENASGTQEITSAGSQRGSYKNSSKGKYPNTLMEECIPCDYRLHGLDELDPSALLLGILEELKKRYKELIDRLKSLLNNTEIAEDICSLLNFLDFQCVPDLYALIVLLSKLMNKYRDIIPNADGVFMQFIGPFFAPLLNGLTELLDKFIAMIMKPIDCIINSLDTQLAKLDVQRALDVAEVQNISFHRRREGYLRRKCEQLEERRASLTGLVDQGADPNDSPPRKIGGLPRSSQSNVLRDVLEENPQTGRAPQVETTIFGTVSIDEELAKINEDLTECKRKYNEQYGAGGENEFYNPKTGKGLIKDSQNPSPSVIGNARGSLRDARKGIFSSLYELRNQTLNGRRMMNDSFRVIGDELQRLIFGRAATSEEMMEGARNVQRISRLIGVVKTLIKLANKGKLCENSNGDPSVALGSFLTANRGTNQTNNYYNVYVGDNDNGDRSLLIAPSDAVLELADPESEDLTQLGNLDEISKLNSDGIPVDLGNITDKRVTATVTDLGFQVPVSVIEFNLCRDSNLSTEADVSKIQDWAVSAGFSI